MKKISTNLYLYEDTCNVYVIKTEEKAVLIDFGDGKVLKHLDTIGVESVTDVFMTHHHRDQCQGLPVAVKEGIRIWVPHNEQDLFHQIDEHWLAGEMGKDGSMG
jgi:glyoxylase-like metal-dependent hydrolase (beta-lactamase superfamily II)